VAGLADAIARRLGQPIAASRPIAGGDINDAFEMRLADGRRLFVKTHAAAPRGMFACEARGLDWLREPRVEGMRIPEVIAVSDEDGDEPAWLALELIESRTRRGTFDAELGAGLARLHQSGAPSFGHVESNVIGRLPQDNRPATTWAAFYAERRLRPQVRAAVDRGRGPRSWTARFERLITRLPALAGPEEPPARLHGDLWGGNVISDEQGAPVLIDPAVYGGHREVDLAMLRLFGSLSAPFLAAYEDVWPLEADHDARVRLYQLYPLLVHVNLFGGSYVQAVDAALRGYE
jgi:fructosamine-3-kinase